MGFEVKETKRLTGQKFKCVETYISTHDISNIFYSNMSIELVKMRFSGNDGGMLWINTLRKASTISLIHNYHPNIL